MPAESMLPACLVKAAAPLLCFLAVFAAAAQGRGPSHEEISEAIVQPDNRRVINAFMKHELGEVNEYATKPLISKYPSLEFFITQANRDPLESLLFLEKQVHRLRDAQKNIDSFPYSLAFSSEEKKKILSLESTAKKIISYGIPLMKRDMYRVLVAIKYLSSKKKKDPMSLLPSPDFRDAVYRQCESDPQALDKAMGELSEGELISMKLGWVLEQVTITRLWLVFNDNKLPEPNAYMAYRKKRSQYWKERLKRIYREAGNTRSNERPATRQ